MRSIPLLAATSVMLAAAWSCGGGSNVGPGGPLANFTVGACAAGTPCQFTNTSTPATGLTYSWNFGDNTTAVVTDPNPLHTFTAAGSYQVALTVTDASKATNTKTTAVTVAAPAGPTAAFSVQCNGAACSFTDASTPTGALTYAWDFGEPGSGAANTSTAQNPTHTYTVTAVTPFTVTLTVTDAHGATGTTNQTITISPAAGLQCATGSGKTVACTITLDQKSTVKLTLSGRHCQLHDSKLQVTTPIQQSLFLNGCSQQIGTVYTLNGPNPDKSFSPGAIQMVFTRGEPGPSDPPATTPAARVTGSFPQWTLAIDDGGNVGGAGEPDFQDLVLTVDVTVVP